MSQNQFPYPKNQKMLHKKIFPLNSFQAKKKLTIKLCSTRAKKFPKHKYFYFQEKTHHSQSFKQRISYFKTSNKEGKIKQKNETLKRVVQIKVVSKFFFYYSQIICHVEQFNIEMFPFKDSSLHSP